MAACILTSVLVAPILLPCTGIKLGKTIVYDRYFDDRYIDYRPYTFFFIRNLYSELRLEFLSFSVTRLRVPYFVP